MAHTGVPSPACGCWCVKPEGRTVCGCAGDGPSGTAVAGDAADVAALHEAYVKQYMEQVQRQLAASRSGAGDDKKDAKPGAKEKGQPACIWPSSVVS